jgi:hypothetical protein
MLATSPISFPSAIHSYSSTNNPASGSIIVISSFAAHTENILQPLSTQSTRVAARSLARMTTTQLDFPTSSMILDLYPLRSSSQPPILKERLTAVSRNFVVPCLLSNTYVVATTSPLIVPHLTVQMIPPTITTPTSPSTPTSLIVMGSVNSL